MENRDEERLSDAALIGQLILSTILPEQLQLMMYCTVVSAVRS